MLKLLLVNVNSVASAPSASDRVSLADSLVLRVKNYFIQLAIIRAGFTTRSYGPSSRILLDCGRSSSRSSTTAIIKDYLSTTNIGRLPELKEVYYLL